MGRLTDSNAENSAKELSPSLVELAETIGKNANATAVFGSPVVHGETIFIPVAQARFGLGGGDSLIAKGLGGGMTAKPLGFIIIERTSVRFHRTPHSWLAPLALGVVRGFAIAMRLMRSPRPRAPSGS